MQLLVIHVLIRDLKIDRGEAFFISASTRFHKLGPKLAIVSIPKCTVYVWIFLFARSVPLLRS